MKLARFKALIIFAITASCAPVGHQYCIGNGFQKNSPQYEQCTLRYKANRDLYEYCTASTGIAQEGPQMNSCIENARKIQNNYAQDSASCSADANKKFAGFLGQQRMEKQPTLRPNGQVTLDDVPVGNYSQSEANSYLAPFINKCLQIYGWNNPGAWQSGKTSTGISHITSGLSALNREPIAMSVPENL